MKKIFGLGLIFLSLAGCAYFSDGEKAEYTELTSAEYSDFAKNVIVVKQTENFVEYEYKNIRVDDMAVLAAIYCHEHNHKKAYLDTIQLYHNNSRRARFVCR